MNVTLDPAVVIVAENHSLVRLAFVTNKLKQKYMNVLGSTQMRKLTVLFDVDAQKIGFGRGNCGSLEPTILKAGLDASGILW